MADALAGQGLPLDLRRPNQAVHVPRSEARAVPRCGPRAAGGCGGALLDVLIEHRHMLVTLAGSFVGCGSQAEDVVHDVFVKLAAFPNQDAIRQPVAYVTRMVRNASIDACHRQTFESAWHAGEEDCFDMASSEPGPEAALATREALRGLRACGAAGSALRQDLRTWQESPRDQLELSERAALAAAGDGPRMGPRRP
ncbi:sigma factor [Paraburkholderia phenazinium]|uniref:Sigma-70 region 2 n=1 Tax=Paraburkholderia phenazinium TaxID=60549 RepID=A0A1G8LNJ3_9BURK|nr:sigma factor [Paraburkholderia phenazinium]SDI57291.1 Sigma-70 region 2 [Paraburkholderia phenazinium]